MESKLRVAVALTGIVVLGLSVVLGLGLNAALAADAGEPKEPEAGPAVQRQVGETIAIVSAIAVATSMACMSAAYAVGRVGAAALGAASERPELLVRSLVFVALGEGIAIFGLIVAVLLFTKLG